MAVNGRGGDEREGLLLNLLNLSSREISSSSQNACLAGGLRQHLLRELKRFQLRPHFQVTNAPKTFSGRGMPGNAGGGGAGAGL